jgi:uncharacterized protein (TIGR04255 family)
MKPLSKLRNPPLLEAIFELRWSPQSSYQDDRVVPDTQLIEPSQMSLFGRAPDPKYPIHLGRFSERVQKQYPFHEPLPSASLPEFMVPQFPQHRFRIGAGKWPLVQMGPGIVTVNETSGYTWTDFRQRCLDTTNWILEANPPDAVPISFREVILRYLNVIEFDTTKDNVFRILKDGLGAKIELAEELFEDTGVSPSASDFNWHATFAYKDLPGSIKIEFGTGKREKLPVLIWGTTVQSVKDNMPNITKGFREWLERAHAISERWFFTPIQGELERRFANAQS